MNPDTSHSKNSSKSNKNIPKKWQNGLSLHANCSDIYVSDLLLAVSREAVGPNLDTIF